MNVFEESLHKIRGYLSIFVQLTRSVYANQYNTKIRLFKFYQN